MLILDNSTRELSLYNGKFFFIKQLDSTNQLFCLNNLKMIKLLPKNHNIGNKLNDYGGTSYCFADDTIILFCELSDGGIYKLDLSTNKITLFYKSKNCVFAYPTWNANLRQLIVICQQQGNTTTQQLVAISNNKLTTIDASSDYYGNYTINSSGDKLAICTWNSPYMPWDITKIKYLKYRNHKWQLQKEIKHNCSVVDPQFYTDKDILFYQADKNNYWSIYDELGNSYRADNYEYSQPLWNIGTKNYHICKNEIYAIATINANFELHKFNIDLTASNKKIAAEVIEKNSYISNLSGDKDSICYLSKDSFNSYELKAIKANNIKSTLIAAHKDTESTNWRIENCRIDNLQFFLHLPHNNKPMPLIMFVHGGPTAMTDSSYNPQIANWIANGFAVADINYSGSSGFGRLFRDSLYGNYGVKDVADSIAIAKYLANNTNIDEDNIFIRGNSSAGFTAIMAVIQSDIFKAAISRYGVINLQSLAAGDCFFEKDYIQRLVANKDEDFNQKANALTILNHCRQLKSPILIEHGSADNVVPYQQALQLTNKLRQINKDYYFVTVANQGHGFDSETKQKLQTIELAFLTNCIGIADYKQRQLLKKHLNCNG